MVQEKTRRAMAEIGYKNPETEVTINKSWGSKGQIKDLSKKRHLNGLHNSNNDLKKKLV